MKKSAKKIKFHYGGGGGGGGVEWSGVPGSCLVLIF